MKLQVAELMQAVGLPPLSPEQLGGHEDNIGENVLVPLLRRSGYEPRGDITRKPSLSHAIVGESRAPDFGICLYQDKPRQLFGLVSDVKRPTVPLTPKLEEKLAGYCGLAGAQYGILTNGVELVVIRPKNGVVDWDYVDHIPTKQSLLQRLIKRPPEYSDPDIIYATRITEEFTEATIEALAKRCHEIIRSRKGMAVPDRLYEFSKLLITRIMDERRFAEREGERLFLTTAALDDLQAKNVDLNDYVNRLFNAVKNSIGIFTKTEKIDLPIDVIQQMVRYLDQFPLWSHEIDVLGQVFEKFLVKTMTGQELGQYFTPRPIVETIVEMVNPKRGQTILDPACGSGGFLIHSLMYMKRKYKPETPAAVRLLAQNIRGLDLFEIATKLCQINLFLHGDCHDNVIRCDSLDADALPDWILKAIDDPGKFGLDCIVTNPPFGAKEGTRLDKSWSKDLCAKWEAHGVDLFECAVSNGKYRDLQPQSPFVELCIKLLKKPKFPGAGGRLGIVIDNGLLSNTQKEEPSIRSLI
ncbi:MAG: N-6 DNA methylase, partial [Candidatus Korobacteraceae bacterium]